MNAGVLWSAFNLIMTGNVLGIPREHMRMQFGSTDREPEPTEEQKQAQAAREVRDRTATIAGISAELQIQSQRMEKLFEELHRTQNLYQTLLNRFEQFERQRVKELQKLLNGGPTA